MVWGAVREASVSLLFLPTAMILARLISPEEAGIAAAASFFTQLAGRLTTFGLGAAVIRIKNLTSEHLAAVFVFGMVLGVGAWGVLALGAEAAGQAFRSAEIAKILPVAGIEFVLLGLGAVPAALLTREMRYRESVATETAGWTTECVSSVVLAWLGFSYWSIVLGGLFGDFVRLVGRVWLTKWRPTVSFSRQAARDVLSFGAGIYFRTLLEYGAQNLDNLIVGRVLGVTALGYYDKAFAMMMRISARLNLTGPGISFRLFALMQEDRERFRRGYRKIIMSATLLGYPAMVGLIVAAPELIRVLLGERWSPATVPFQVLCAAAMLRILNAYASTATQAMGRIWSEVGRQFLFVIVLVLSVFAFSRWGINGAAVGVLVATCVMTTLLQLLVRRITGFSWPDLLAPQAPAIKCAVGMASVLLVARLALTGFAPTLPALARLAVLGFSGAAYYAAFLIFHKAPDVHETVHDTLKEFATRMAVRFRRWAKFEPSGSPISSKP
jgi:lipopolysaccharide exporter